METSDLYDEIFNKSWKNFHSLSNWLFEGKLSLIHGQFVQCLAHCSLRWPRIDSRLVCLTTSGWPMLHTRNANKTGCIDLGWPLSQYLHSYIDQQPGQSWRLCQRAGVAYVRFLSGGRPNCNKLLLSNKEPRSKIGLTKSRQEP